MSLSKLGSLKPTSRKDALALAGLTGVVVAWLSAALAFGLEHTPDSGLYLFSGAKGYLSGLATSTPSNYAPGFPWLTSGALLLCRLPGDAGIVVQAASLAVVVLGSYGVLRASAASAGLAFAGALLMGFCPSSSYVFALQLSEGPTCALLVLLVALFFGVLARQTLGWRLCLVALASLAPLLRYGAAGVPVGVACMLALSADTGLPLAARLLRFGRDLLLGVLPIALYFAWNRVREGTVTSHPAARVGVWDNLQSALSTFVEAFSGLPFVFALLALIVIAAAWRKAGPLRQTPAMLTALFALVVSFAYLAGLIAGASVVLVDRLSMRLCAPSITLLLLALIIALSCALERLATQRSPLRHAGIACALVAVIAVLSPMRESLFKPLRMLATGKRTKVTATFETGFRRSKAALGLAQFYADELARAPMLSVTFVEAKRSPGRVRRGWMMMAGVLGNTPTRLDAWGALKLETLTETSALFHWGDPSHRILFLSGDMPESRRLPGDMSVEAFVADVVQRVLTEARAADRAEHWLLFPRDARWLAPAEDMLGTAKVLRERMAGSYRAVLLGT